MPGISRGAKCPCPPPLPHCPSCLGMLRLPFAGATGAAKTVCLKALQHEWRLTRYMEAGLPTLCSAARRRRAGVHLWREINPPLIPSPQPIPQPATVVRWSWPCTCPVSRISAGATAQSQPAQCCCCSVACRFAGRQGHEELRTYTFNTHTAKHFFYSVCGIYHRSGALNRVSMANIACMEGIRIEDFQHVAYLDGRDNHPRDV